MTATSRDKERGGIWELGSINTERAVGYFIRDSRMSAGEFVERFGALRRGAVGATYDRPASVGNEGGVLDLERGRTWSRMIR